MAVGTMTIRQALVAAMSPYALPSDTIDFLLIQQDLDGSVNYTSDVQTELYTAVIDGLYRVKTLTKEKDPGTENDYDVSKIDDIIAYYRKKYGIESPNETDDYFVDLTDEF